MSKLLLICIFNNKFRDSVPIPFFQSVLANLRHFDIYEIDYTIKFFSSLRIDASRNQAIDYAQREQYKFVLFLDDDMSFPENCFYTLYQHMYDNKPCVSALYCAKEYPYQFFLSEKGGKKWLYAYEKDKMYSVDNLATGCLMMNINIFDKIKRPYFLLRYDEYGRLACTEDCYFANLLLHADVDMYVDASLSCQHLKLNAFPDFYKNPYINHKYTMIFDKYNIGNCDKTQLVDDHANQFTSLFVQEPTKNLTWIDGINKCNHKNVEVMPTNDITHRLLKCQDCQQIIELKFDQ